MINLSYVAVSGYGWSGSGAVIDLLRGIDGFSTPGFEFSLIKDPYGIIDLENFLIDNWDVVRHDHAIHKFLDFCEVLNRSNNCIGKWGIDIGKKLNVDFLDESIIYINSLTEFNYRGYYRTDHYWLNDFQSLIKKIQRKLGNISSSSSLKIFSKPSYEKFINATQLYLNNIFSGFAKKNDCNKIILDQAIPTSNITKALRYFNEIKLIIVDRDPRDIYVDLIEQQKMIGIDYKDKEMLNKYIIWHKKIRSNINKSILRSHNDQILQIQFEDLINDYQPTREIIFRFLGLNVINCNSNSYFDPMASKKNVGIWKNWKNQNEIEIIKNKLIDNV